MRKGIVKSRCISHKNGRKTIRAKEAVTEADVLDFAKLVSKGHITETVEEAAEEAAAKAVEEVDLTTLTKAELKAKCDTLGIAYTTSNTNAELIALIEAV